MSAFVPVFLSAANPGSLPRQPQNWQQVLALRQGRPVSSSWHLRPAASASLTAALGIAAAAAAGRRRRAAARALACGARAVSSFRPTAVPSQLARRVHGAVGARSAAEAATSEPLPQQEVPVVLLSGFLGTGKTTLLRHWLENSEDRIGIVVNDVAAVNIDSKLVQQSSYGAEGQVNAIQLQNGCACCSLGDELLVSVADLLELGSHDGEPFKQVVVELSGVAEPARVRQIFEQAKQQGSVLVQDVKLEKVVTLLDASTFCTDYMEFAGIEEREDLMDGDPGEAADLKVVELLVEQAEAADVIILNKTDLATKDQVEATRNVAQALAKTATICETSFGKVALSDVLRDHSHHEHSDHGEEHGHAEHAHEAHSHAEKITHGEEHGHAEHGHSHAADCNKADCTDPSHGHSHGHAAECHDPDCTDASHGHSHDHAAECHDPDCTDASHGHEHGHSHSHSSTTTAEDRFNITSFCYKARRPFHEKRFTEALQAWPIPKHDDLGLLLTQPSEMTHPLQRVIRSKGFCWLETHPSSRMYWSHAGKDMRLTYEGVWWGAMSEMQIKMFESMQSGEYARARKEDWDEDCADRRQEIVFIGQRMDEAAIRKLLDDCCLTDEEMVRYKKIQEAELKASKQVQEESFEKYNYEP